MYIDIIFEKFNIYFKILKISISGIYKQLELVKYLFNLYLVLAISVILKRTNDTFHFGLYYFAIYIFTPLIFKAVKSCGWPQNGP